MRRHAKGNTKFSLIEQALATLLTNQTAFLPASKEIWTKSRHCCCGMIEFWRTFLTR